MTKLKIDRLALRVNGLSESDAKRLSHAVSQQLASRISPVRESVRLDNVRVSLPAGSKPNLDALAGEIAAQILMEVRGTL